MLTAVALAGIAVVDDYGVSWHAEMQRSIGWAALNYVLGEGCERRKRYCERPTGLRDNDYFLKIRAAFPGDTG